MKPPSQEQIVTALRTEVDSLVGYRQFQEMQIEKLQYQVRHLEVLMLARIPKFEDSVAMLAEMYARHIRIYQRQMKEKKDA